MTDRPDLDEAYMKDAIATAQQMGAVVKDAPAAKTPNFIVQGDDAAIEEHIRAGVARGTITDATPKAAEGLVHPHDLAKLSMTAQRAAEDNLMAYADPAAEGLLHPHDLAKLSMTAQRATEQTLSAYADPKPAVGDGKFTSRADIAGPKSGSREIG